MAHVLLELGQSEVRQVLLSLAEILSHRVDQNLILFFEADESSLQLYFQLHQVRRYLTFKTAKHKFRIT